MDFDITHSSVMSFRTRTLTIKQLVTLNYVDFLRILIEVWVMKISQFRPFGSIARLQPIVQICVILI